MSAFSAQDHISEFVFARWLLPISSPKLEHACLALSGDKIAAVLDRSAYDALPERVKSCPLTDFGEAVILPGMLNLHTHLDYSALKHFDNYSGFFQWIRGLIGNSWQWSQKEWFQSALYGARELLQSGSSFALDSSYSGAAAKAIAATGLRGLVGLELFGIDEAQADSGFTEWLERYERLRNEPELKAAQAEDRLKLTIAPHTPYSVCPALLRKAVAWAKEHDLPVLIHIAESKAECRWLADKDPDLDKFLQEAFKTLPGELPWKGKGDSPVEHLERHGLLSEELVAAHLVQLDDKDIDLLAKRNVKGIHCPRSNSRLRNGVAPFSKLIAKGIQVGLGTDSAASSDDLNLLAEARFALALHRAVNEDFSCQAEEILFYLTLGAAKILKMDARIGSLEPGKAADFAVFSLSELAPATREHPCESLVYGGAILKELRVNGKILFSPDLNVSTPGTFEKSSSRT